MKNNNLLTEYDNKHLDLYQADLIFRRPKKPGPTKVTIRIRRSKKEKFKKQKIIVPDYISLEDLSWTKKHQAHYITVIERLGNSLEYFDKHTNEEIPLALSQNLEKLVHDVYFDE